MCSGKLSTMERPRRTLPRGSLVPTPRPSTELWSGGGGATAPQGYMLGRGGGAVCPRGSRRPEGWVRSAGEVRHGGSGFRCSSTGDGSGLHLAHVPPPPPNLLQVMSSVQPLNKGAPTTCCWGRGSLDPSSLTLRTPSNPPPSHLYQLCP